MGYATKACPANRFQHAAAQFQDITSKTLDLDTTFSGLPGVKFDDVDKIFRGTAPQIQVVQSDGTADVYYYLTDGWYKDDNGKAAYKAGWCNDFGVLVDIEIAAQSGFWVKATTGAFTFNYKR